jgi:hypothetical protein
MLHQVFQHYMLLLLHYCLALEEAVEELLKLHAALLHLALADVLTNLHAFVTIVTNHCGNDLYRPGERTPP